MPDETKHGFDCSEFEGLLSEAMDGRLSGAGKERFDAHANGCPLCGPLFADAVAGRQWMLSLAEVEPPVNLVHNILAATTGLQTGRIQVSRAEAGRAPLGERLREWWDSFLTPTVNFVRQPRFVMSFGMIFFSFSLALSAAGVRPSDIAKVDLRPSALRLSYHTTQGRIVKFYENIRLVYEIESRVREFKRATTPAEPGPKKPAQDRKNDTSGQPEQKQDRNYAQQENQPVLAGLPGTEFSGATRLRKGIADAANPGKLLLVGRAEEPPAVTGTTNRRYV